MDHLRWQQDTPQWAGAPFGVGLAIALLWLAWSATVAATEIYKCVGPDQRVLYTDVPCPNGKRLDIRAGDPDPDAVSRVDRERDALARSATQRIEDERRASATRQMVAASADSRSRDVAADDSGWYTPYGWGWAPQEPRRHPRPPEERSPERAREQPYIVIKQPPRLPRQ